MQVINLEATISTPSLQVEMRTLRLGSGGTTDYNDLSNKPMIEGVTLQGNVPISDLGLRTSDLINDSGFITTGDIPTKTSDLTNDSDFQTGAEVAASITAAIPTNVSSFTNDVGYITAAAIPTNVSAFTNDAGYLTSGDLPAFAVDSVNGQTGTVVLTGADIECGGSYHTNETIANQIDAFTTDIANLTATMPTKTSDLQNDSGYITATGAPVQTVNGATGDVVLDGSDIEYSAGVTVNSKIDAVEASIPTIPVASVNGQTGAVVLDGDDIEYSTGVTVNNKIDSIEAAIPTDTATIENVAMASFNDGEYNKPLDDLIVTITPVQAAGTPTPLSPIPITGWTSATVTNDKYYGGKIDFNQKVKNGNFADTSNWTANNSTFSVSDNVATIQPSAQNGRIVQNVSFPLGHKMLTILDFKGAVGIAYGFNGLIPNTTGTGEWVTLYKIMESPVVSNVAIMFMAHQSYDGFSNPFYVKNVRLFDLTQMFGSEKATEIEAMETEHTGDGFAYVRSILPHDYYDYTESTVETAMEANGEVNPQATTQFGQTVFGGELNVLTGELTITMGEIASYNGESINEPWLSSYDEYAPGTTPTTGAQVVYTLDTPTTVSLTPTEVKSIIAYNNIYTDSGDIKSLTYYKLTPLGVYNWVKTQN